MVGVLAMAGCSAIADFKGLAGDSLATTGDASTVDAASLDGASLVDAATDAADANVGRPTPTSCLDGGPGASATCGASKNEDCCASLGVPGGDYLRSNDTGYPATVSAFYLDRYEITVGRFRAFVNAGFGTSANPPAAGSGAHPKIPGSGWDPTWSTKLAPNTNALRNALQCGYSRFSSTPGTDESFPASCFDWYTAFAFCVWDGGRMPTESEWNFAAAGGNEQRKYPWSSQQGPSVIDPTYATYGCFAHGGTPKYDDAGAPICVAADITAVGVHSPKGDGKWGHADLAGNMWEWTLDTHQTPYRSGACVDCANTDFTASSQRVFRSGDYDTDPSSLDTAYRAYADPANYQDDRSVRCARDR